MSRKTAQHSGSLVMRKPLPPLHHRRKKTSNRPGGVFVKKIFFSLLALIIFSGVLLAFFAITVSKTDLPSTVILIRSTKVDSNVDHPTMVWYDSSRKKIKIIDFDKNMTVDLAGGFGNYKLNAVGPLLAIDKKNLSEQRSLFSLAIWYPINQLWEIHQPVTFNDDKNITQLADLLIKNQINAPISNSQRWRWWLLLRFLRPDQITYTNVSDFEDWQSIQEQLHVSAQSDCSVTIVNLTSISGMARLWGSLTEKMGISVVRVTDEQDTGDKTHLVLDTDSKQCQKVTSQIQQILPFAAPTSNETNIRSRYRSDVVLFLGQDMASFWSGTKN